jgi:hypothetical protein
MDALSSLFIRADESRLLTPLQPRVMRYRVFLYADDLVIFLAPTERDASVVRALLEVFAAESGLFTNIAKCALSPIRCSEEDVARVQLALPCQIAPFPCKFLGVPLSVHKLRKEDLQPLADAVAYRLPSWKARLMSRAGRTTLTKVTLSAILVVKVDPWIIRMVDKLRRAFIWDGSDTVRGGRCLVAWRKVTRPMELGGLGDTLGYALRLRWEWQARTAPDKPWASLASRPEWAVQAMF